MVTARPGAHGAEIFSPTCEHTPSPQSNAAAWVKYRIADSVARFGDKNAVSRTKQQPWAALQRHRQWAASQCHRQWAE